MPPSLRISSDSPLIITLIAMDVVILKKANEIYFFHSF